jgi:hypothetical protein
MDEQRTAAPSRPPSRSDGRIAWPFEPRFPSSDRQRTPPKGAFGCADPDQREGLTPLDTVDRQAMSAQTEQRPAGATRRSALRAGDPSGEPLEMLVDQGAGRVLLRDRGELVGYELRMREGFGRAFGLGWVELLLAADGAVVETGVSAAEVIALARDAARELDVAELSSWAAEQFVASGDPLTARMGRRLLREVRDGLSSSGSRSARSRPACSSGSRPASRSP